jgi:hypothetical protein
MSDDPGEGTNHPALPFLSGCKWLLKSPNSKLARFPSELITGKETVHGHFQTNLNQLMKNGRKSQWRARNHRDKAPTGECKSIFPLKNGF